MPSSEEEEFTRDPEEDEDFEAEENGEEEEDADDGDAEEEDSDDDYNDEPLASLKHGSDRKKRTAKSSAPSYKEDDDDDDDELEEKESSDDDDDVPLSSLSAPKEKSPAAKKQKPAAATNGTKKKKAAESPKKKKKKAAPKKETPNNTASTSNNSSSNNKNYEWASAALYGTSCDKGLLIQRLLCRWWYAYEWPTNVPAKPPAGYDALDGFPGVFICTSPDAVGRIRDTRDAAAAPSFRNFAKKSADELRDMLVRALEEQKRQLVAAEGRGTTTEKELDELLKWARKVNGTKADKEAAKVLKSQGLKLPSS